MIDVRLLQVLKERKSYNKLRAYVPDRALDTETRVLLDDFKEYFTEFNTEYIDFDTFITWFETCKHKKLSAEHKEVYRRILRTVLKSEIPDEVRDGLLKNMNDLRLGHEMQALLSQWDEGEVPDLQLKLADLHERAKRAHAAISTWVKPDIRAFLERAMNEDGLHWPLPVMEAEIKPLQPGDFIILGGRPGIGKTAWICFLTAYFATQLPEDKNILWLNNEGPGNKINARHYQAVLKCSISGLMQKLQAGTLEEEYLKIMLREDKFQVHDVHGKTMAQVSGILEDANPGIIVFDMLNNIRADSDSDRSDLNAEHKAQWARELQVRFGSIGIATWQISAEGDNNLFPQQSALMNSKTSLQGACDMIMMLGCTNQKGSENVRGLSVVKTKMQREGRNGDPHCMLNFCKDTAQFTMLDNEYDVGTTQIPEDY